MMDLTPREEFLQLVSRPEREIDLAVGALLIAKEEYPEIDPSRYLAMLDDLAARARNAVGRAGSNPFAIIDALNRFLFDELGFRGNTEDYFDPRNSYLNEVLDRRRGIPITLSLVYMEIGRRVGFPLQGVGFPGHFLVRHSDAGREILIDPFHAGEILVPEDCRRRLEEVVGRDVPLEARFLKGVGTRQILIRMLNNLKQIHIERDDDERALAVIDRLLALEPDDLENLRDRGTAHLRLSHFGRASQDLEAYLRLAPDARDTPTVLEQLKALRRLTAMLN